MVINKTLNCGVRIMLEQIPHVESVAMGIFVKAGACDEEEKYSGISHFIEHMMFKGTEKRSAKEIAEDVDKIGGNINAYTSKEHTCYHIRTLKSNAEKAAEILLDMFIASKFDPKEMTRERHVIFEEMSMVEDTPDDLAYETAMENVFRGNPLANSILGSRSSLKRISRRVMTDYIAKEYTKDSIVVSVAGNFDEDRICAVFDEGLANLPEKKEKKIYTPTPHTPAFSVKVKEIEQSHIILAARGIRLDDDNYYSVSVLNNIMGGSMSSRLFQNIREQKGLAYSVYSILSPYVDMGAYAIYAGVSHNRVKDAIAAIKEELLALEKNGVTDEELQKAKEQLKGGYIYSRESVNNRMISMGREMLLIGKNYTADDVIGGIDGVTQDDLREAAKLISNVENYSAAVVTNRRIDLKGYVRG